MNPINDNPEDDRLAKLLGLAAGDVPPPDEAFLDRLRRQSAAVFAAEPPDCWTAGPIAP